MVPFLAHGHGGGLDAQGGHTNRSTGEYHCHRSSCSVPGLSEQHDSQRYRREDWRHWLDADGDCQNTRHEVLIAQADGPVVLSANGCAVEAGVWVGPFSGKTYTRPSDLDIDHVVPLSWAHRRGGAEWSAQLKADFANDPINLLIVDDGLNQSKGDQGPDEWMPPNEAFHCEYLGMWINVIAKYPGLAFNVVEKRAVSAMLSDC